MNKPIEATMTPLSGSAIDLKKQPLLKGSNNNLIEKKCSSNQKSTF